MLYQFSYGQQLTFKEIELPEEMIVSKITQDRNGFLWLCTNKGIVLYNGYEFEQVGLQNKKISTVCTTDNFYIWIGTSEGEIYSILYNQRESKPKLIAKLNAPIKDIITYPKGLAIATYGDGLYKYQNNKIISVNTVSSKEIYDLEIIKGTSIAVASDRGIDIVDLENFSVFENLKSLPDNIIIGICKNKDRLVAATYDSKLFSINLKDKSIEIIDENPKKEKYLGLQCDGSKVLVHTSNEIAEWQNGKKTIFSQKQNEKKISSFYVDDENNLWLAQGKNALFKSNLFFLSYKIDITHDLQAMAYYDKLYYLGTTQGIFIKSDITKASIDVLLPKENITVIKEYNSKLWIGTFSNGLYVYEVAKKKMFHFGNVENIDDNTILDIEMSIDNQVEIATLSGIKSIDENLYETKKFKNVVLNVYSYDIFLDKQGNRWYGKDRNGITKITRNDTIEYKAIENSMDHKQYKLGSIYSIAEHQNAIYFASAALGLVQYKDNVWTIIPTTHKPNDPITSIAKQGDQSLLLIRSSRFDIVDLRDLHILPYFNEKVVSENNLFLNNYCEVDGDVYFGYDKGITRFSKNTILKKDPQITLDKIEVNLERVKEGEHVFSQDENNLRFTFIGCWLTDPKLVDYVYKLEGFDNEWRRTTDRVVSYPKLPPSKYTFKVRASENSTFKNEKMVEYSFEIKKAYYNTWWFYALLISMTGIFLYWLQQRKKNEELLKAELSKKIIETELINLKSQLDPHFLFNTFNTLIGLIEEDAKKGVRFTEILTSFFRSLSELGNKELVTMEEELVLVKNYREILKERFGSNLQIDISDKINDIADTFIPPMSLQMLIENAVKHNEVSKANPLIVAIYCDDQYIIVKNLKHKKRAGSVTSLGIGNNNIIERYRLLGLDAPIIDNAEESYAFYLPIVRHDKKSKSLNLLM